MLFTVKQDIGKHRILEQKFPFHPADNFELQQAFDFSNNRWISTLKTQKIEQK